MMDALEQARREIDTVDAQLAALFERRMKAVLSVAEYKKAHGLPIFDAAREKVVLDKAEARIGDPALRPYYRDHVQNMMDVAKQYEAEVLGRNRAAYQGVEGAFAHIALRALFPHAEAVSCPTWDEVFDAVEKGDAAHGVVPFENSHAGDVSAVLDLCYNHPGLWVPSVRTQGYLPRRIVPPLAVTFTWSGIRAITGCVVASENSAELASFSPATWRANSTTAICIPRQMPKKGT